MVTDSKKEEMQLKKVKKEKRELFARSYLVAHSFAASVGEGGRGGVRASSAVRDPRCAAAASSVGPRREAWPRIWNRPYLSCLTQEATCLGLKRTPRTHDYRERETSLPPKCSHCRARPGAAPNAGKKPSPSLRVLASVSIVTLFLLAIIHRLLFHFSLPCP